MEATQPIEEHRFPCDACGADLRFSPGEYELRCDHCGNVQAIDGLRQRGSHDTEIAEQDYRAAIEGAGSAEMEVTRVLNCPNCAAQVEFSPEVHARECPFCATPIVTDTGENRHIKPEALLPFHLAEEHARQAMTDWLGRLWFAPGGLQQYARKGRRMQGIYVPYWTYDARTRSAYFGHRGTVYYVSKTVTRNGKKQQVRQQKVRWTPKSGRVARDFDDVLVLASESLPKPYTDALAPWDLSELVPYTPEVLAGFRAEAYTVELDAGFTEARTYMDRVIQRDVRFDIGGDRQRIERVETQVSDVTFKHVLLPVWLAAYKYRGKTYRFVVNGRTGAVKGERPWSGWKIFLTVLIALILAAAVGYGIAISETTGSPG